MKDKLHIAHYTNTYYPVMSGVVRSISTFRAAQEELGHFTAVFCQEAKKYVDEESFVFRYPSINIPLRNYPVNIPTSSHVDWLMPSLPLDIIHTHHPAPMGEAASNQAEKMGIPLVFTHHTRYQEYVKTWGDSTGLAVDVVERLIGDFMKKCHHVVVPSPSIKQMLADTYGVTEAVTVVPTGIDLTPYAEVTGESVRAAQKWGEDDIVLVSIGRLAQEKNFETLIDAVAINMKKHPNLHFMLIGDGPSRSDLEKQCKKLGIADRVYFTGRISFEEVPNHMKAADLFAFASITETQGLVTLEAMAADLPVVAVDATGTSDIVIDEVNGLLTANDSDALAVGIGRLLSDTALEQKLRDGAKGTAQEYETSHVTARMIDVYRQAIAAKKAGKYIQVDERKPIYKVMWNKLFD